MKEKEQVIFNMTNWLRADTLKELVDKVEKCTPLTVGISNPDYMELLWGEEHYIGRLQGNRIITVFEAF